MPLLLAEATTRAAAITVQSYDVTLDLDTGDETFESTSVIRFAGTQAGTETFLDVKATTVHSITFNGASIDPSQVAGGRVTLTGLQEANEVTVVATMAYGHDGQGLHRSLDPADGKSYVYGMSFLDAAPQVFACFDQPDLKAPYNFHVKAPADWIVVGNTAASEPDGDGWWHLPPTRPLSTYFVCICAGPYASQTDSHDGIPLAIHARASMAAELAAQAPQMFQVTKQGLDYYHGLFGIRYPWGEYHQFFVPEFNAGAMENPGCVTFRDTYIFRGAITRAQLFQRTNTITHEMAHMWFGDLVTMKWWDDLWLNESFAEYMAHRSAAEATEFSEAWVDFGIARKNWGYNADRAPSTHPIAGAPAPDSDSALTNFDGISYAKGASALRQLAAYVGDDAFIAGVRDHLSTHSYGNATLADFLGAIERASGKDLGDWSTNWLRTSGTDLLGVDAGSGDDLQSLTITRTAPVNTPADRPHVLDIAGFTDGEEVWRTPTFEVSEDTRSVPDVEGKARPTLLLPNASDLTWALVQFDGATLQALPDELTRLQDPLAREVIWSNLIQGVFTGTVPPQTMLDAVAKAWPGETDASLSAVVPRYAQRMLPGLFLADAEQVLAVIAQAAADRLGRAGSAEDEVVPARVLAQSSSDETQLRAWMAGEQVPQALAQDQDFRWSAVIRLASLGLLDEAAIEAHAASDHTMTGRQSSLTAKAARPTADAKRWAWDQITGNEKLSNYDVDALAEEFFHCRDESVVEPYIERYFHEVPLLAGRFGEYAVASLATGLFPSVPLRDSTLELANAAIGRDGLSPGVRRAMVDQAFVVQEALASRGRYSS